MAIGYSSICDITGEVLVFDSIGLTMLVVLKVELDLGEYRYG